MSSPDLRSVAFPMYRSLNRGVIGVMLSWYLVACQPIDPASQKSKAMTNPLVYFEIPVTDMKRAIDFYSAVFGYSFEEQTIDGYQMALFPFTEGSPGATGALAKGDVYVPSMTGAIIYLRVQSIERTIEKAKAKGAQVLYAKKDIGDNGFVAEIKDSEGNRIALHQSK